MAKIQLVIELDEKLNEEAKEYYIWIQSEKGFSPFKDIYEAITKGTIIPRGHGDLKDVDAIHEEIYRLQSGIGKNGGAVIIKKDQYKGLCYARGIINEAPVIIEADGGEADE